MMYSPYDYSKTSRRLCKLCNFAAVTFFNLIDSELLSISILDSAMQDGYIETVVYFFALSMSFIFEFFIY